MSRITYVETYWPRRLLHVDGQTLTSVERVGNATYGTFERPTYNILSYTWGRFESSAGEAIVIHNTPWKIPRIRPDHFTTSDFYRVINRVSQGCSHIWIDVACIHQENEAIKLSEIGHQAAIFQGARCAFIWLSHCSVDGLEPLRQQIMYDEVPRFSTIMRKRTRYFQRSLQIFQHLFNDPWFSSLWTLQEAFLRPDATVLTKDASTLLYDSLGDDMWLELLLEFFSDVYDIMQTLLRNSKSLKKSQTGKIFLAREIVKLISDAGAKELHLSNGIQLYAISTSRNPRDHKDKIYGIQQVFGTALGETARTWNGTRFTLEELEDLLGDHIGILSPIFSQMWIRIGDSQPKRSFSLSSRLTVPPYITDNLTRVSLDGHKSMGSISFHKWFGHWFSGYLCDFSTMCSYWKTARIHFSSKALERRPDYRIEYIHLDQTDRNQRAFPTALLQEGSLCGRPGELNALILAEYGIETRVFLLGKIISSDRVRHESSWTGILAYPVNDDGDIYWTRIGICIWDVGDKELETKVEGLFLSKAYQLPLY
ncbi:heterokaryon incompatibility protein-domain-containing protein [Xylaria scruposa]|nr:heterokaryon incompatibility protein-domain-containing protein [Xylaria scruposa]